MILERFLEKREDPEGRHLLAVAKWQQRKFTEAGEGLRRVIAESPGYVRAYSTLASFLRERPEEFPQATWGEPRRQVELSVSLNPLLAPRRYQRS